MKVIYVDDKERDVFIHDMFTHHCTALASEGHSANIVIQHESYCLKMSLGGKDPVGS